MTHPFTRQNDSAADTGLSCAAPGRPERRRAIAAGLSLIGGGLLTAGLTRPALAAVSADGVLARASSCLLAAGVENCPLVRGGGLRQVTLLDGPPGVGISRPASVVVLWWGWRSPALVQR